MGMITVLAPTVEADASNAARIHAATLACIARLGMTKTTLDDIARESGLSRATIYREHPGGRDTLFPAVLMAEVDRFFTALGAELDRIRDLEELLVTGLGASMRFLREHPALHTIITTEPTLLLPTVSLHGLDGVLARATAFAAPYLRTHVADDAAARSGAEHLVRIVLSYTLHPSDRVDPSDTESVRRLVRAHALPAVASAATPPAPDPSIDSVSSQNQSRERERSQKGQS